MLGPRTHGVEQEGFQIGISSWEMTENVHMFFIFPQDKSQRENLEGKVMDTVVDIWSPSWWKPVCFVPKHYSTPLHTVNTVF